MARRLVLRLKHGDRTDIVRPAAGWMLRTGDGLIGEDTVLVPVPLNWRRFLKRTYNQAALLAQDMARPRCRNLSISRPPPEYFAQDEALRV